MRTKFNYYIENLQDIITQKLADVDGKAHFKEDLWERLGGGGGRTRVIENGAVFAKSIILALVPSVEKLSIEGSKFPSHIITSAGFNSLICSRDESIHCISFQ